MERDRLLLVLAGMAASALVGVRADLTGGPALIAQLSAEARVALDRAGGKTILADFSDAHGWLTRHPTLSGGEGLSDAARTRAAAAVAAIAGMGGVHWRPRTTSRHAGAGADSPALNCQQHVTAILATNTIRFREASAALDPASGVLLDAVAAALRPCGGSVIAITGHTDDSGDADANLALSRERALSVRDALAARGIDMAGLRATGVGSQRPIAGLLPSDPANRRIEFSVIEPAVLEPTPVDTPGPG